MAKIESADNGIRDNLYGIPLDNIYTPEEISELKKDRRDRLTKSRRKRIAKKQNDKRKLVPPTRKQVYIAVSVLAAVVALFAFKNPFIARVNPRLYVSDAMANTVSAMQKTGKDAAKDFFGFNILKSGDATVSFDTTISADSDNLASGFSVKGNVMVSPKHNEGSAACEYSDNGQPYFTPSVYLNDNEAGFNIRELFGEYWVSPAKDFGKAWNNSGFRKALYLDSIAEEADISYSGIFPLSKILTDKSVKQIKKQADRAISLSKGKYLGKSEFYIGGKTVRARTFGFDFDEAELKERLILIFDTVLSDEVFVNKSSTVYKNLYKDITEVARRLNDGITFSDGVYMTVGEYDGKIVSIEFVSEYTENTHATVLDFKFTLGDTGDVCNDMAVSVNVSGADNSFAFDCVSRGNHSMKKKGFSDKTVITIVRNGIATETVSESTFDFKTGQANIRLTKTDGTAPFSVELSGKCKKQNGINFEFDTAKICVTEKDHQRLFSATGNLHIGPGLTAEKINPSGKKPVLDMDKTDVESYIRKIEETDRYKVAKENLVRLFGE